MSWYLVRVLDADGCDLISPHEIAGKAAAIADARSYLSDPEYGADVARLEVLDQKGTKRQRFETPVVWDWDK